MNESQWRELAEIMSDQAATWVDSHPRFLRSLSWGDDDYEGLVFKFFGRFLGDDFEHLDLCVDFLDLEAWLEQHEPAWHAELCLGTSVYVLPEEDLANLPDGNAIRENLRRLQDQLEARDAAATIGTAKDLIESTAKVVLTCEGLPIAKNEDLPSLIKRTHKVVNLYAKTAVHANPDVEAAVKKIRGGLQSIALGIVYLRNEVGTGHGRIATSPSGLADDARLAADAAAAWIRSILAAYSEFTNRTL